MIDSKVSIMQPYLFPYLGYFQLLKSVDHFVFYDDVNFIKQGWVNRNKLLINNEPKLFTVPIEKISSFQEIRESKINYKNYSSWYKKFEKSLYQNYKKAPYFDEVYDLVKSILNKNYQSISELAIASIKEVCQYLTIERNFLISSKDFPETKGLDKADRVIQICKLLSSNHYINPQGGSELYSKDYFNEHNINLYFIKNNIIPYPQFQKDFQPALSIIDVLMFNSAVKISEDLLTFSYE